MTGKNLLVLGGTGWVARFVAEIAAAQGTEVTCLARGSKAAPAGVRFVQGDRTRPDAYDQLLDREWDEVIDVTWQPGQARTAVAALAARAARWPRAPRTGRARRALDVCLLRRGLSGRHPAGRDSRAAGE